MTSVVVDVAGARVGGAKRYLAELDAYLASTGRADVAVIGRGRALTPLWLLERERLARGHGTKVAINNASFFRDGGERVVALRNALHFAGKDELASLGYQPPRSLSAQVPLIRRLARRADRVEVPCTAMAERVLRFLPDLRSRINVRHHPVAPRPWSASAGTAPELLMPILNAPYKRLSEHLTALLVALEDAPALERILVTASAEEFPARVREDERVHFIGRLTHQELDAHMARSRAIYFPTQLESFGYPLAEARVNGRRVVALDTAQNREIAGEALAPFHFGDIASLAAALSEAMSVAVNPDPEPFDPRRYFDEFLVAS